MTRALRNPKAYGVPQKGREFGKVQQVGDENGGAEGPPAPSGLTAALETRYRVDLDWTDNSGGTAEHRVERNSGGAGWTTRQTVAMGVVTYSDLLTNPDITTEQVYRIIAVRDGLESSPSSTAAFTMNYRYGYPTVGPTESDVVFQARFNVASGNVTDDVGSVVLTPFTSGGGSTTYSVAETGKYENIDPGISMNASGGQLSDFRNLTAITALDVAANEAVVIEVWAMPTGSLGVKYFLSFNADGSATDYGLLWYWLSGTSMSIDWRSDDETEISRGFTIPDYSSSTTPVYWKMVWDPDNDTLELFTMATGDSAPTSRGSGTMAALAGKTVTNNGIRVNGQYNNGSAIGTVQWHELRVSIGAGAATNTSIVLPD